ncbi:caspase family protein [Sorangium sp. So ce861]|uniref:caspase family protein n=1 Tax=Sorangium sp. So ce861 TaxID=3133323 RepID=UPI003F632A71
MKKRAVLVGINDYAGNPLAGPVNDVALMSEFLRDRCGFSVDTEIVSAVQMAGSKSAILERLQWLVRGAEPRDQLLFHFSGHGDQLDTSDDAGELDRLDEVLCALGFDRTNATAIRDDELTALFSTLRTGAHVVWTCDSCHAGGMTPASARGGQPAAENRTARGWSAAAAAEPRAARGNDRRRAERRMRRAMSELPVVFVGACAEGQRAYEGPLGGRVHGALTYHLVRELEQPGGLTTPLARIVDGATRAMSRAGYAQDAVLVAPRGREDAPLFGP